MTSIYDLLKDENNKILEANSLRTELVEEKRMRNLDEANVWTTTDFKEKGATNDKMRTAIVQQEMNKFPNTYSQKKAKLENLENEIKGIRDMINVMKTFGVDEIKL